MTLQPLDWVPDACTLPTAEQPLRAADFGELFATAMETRTRVAPTHLRFVLHDAADVEATTRDLIEKESGCCSFFDFSLAHAPGDRLKLDVKVPAGQVAVLDALSALADSSKAEAGTAGT